MKPSLPCPCTAGPVYGDCCGRLHAGALPDTAEQLMRSRYCAYALGLSDYLLATWHPTTRPPSLRLDDATSRDTRWLGLDIVAHRPNGDAAEIKFVARYRIGGARAVRMRETSRFVREGGQWFYVDGDLSHG
jgi:SEC-C motif domain protein